MAFGLGAASSTHVLVCLARVSPYFPYFGECGSSGWAGVIVRPWKSGNYPKIGNLSVFVLLGLRFVFGINLIFEGLDPFLFRCRHDSWD